MANLCPQRGWGEVETVNRCIIDAAWPELDPAWRDEAIENQFALYQAALSDLREIRNSQNIGNKKKVKFSIKCTADIGDLLRPLGVYFSRMANAELIELGPSAEAPETSATRTTAEMEIYVDLDGLIDIEAEVKRLEKEKANLEKSISSKQRQLSNEKFVAAKPDLADEIRTSLLQAESQLSTIAESLQKMIAKL